MSARNVNAAKRREAAMGRRLGKAIALDRLATTAREDADNCDDDNTLTGSATTPEKYVRLALYALAEQLHRRAAVLRQKEIRR